MPELNREDPKVRHLTIPQAIALHRESAACAGCHRKIDPLGLAFENYDAIGRWRTEEIVEGSGKNPTVNPAGKLPQRLESLSFH